MSRLLTAGQAEELHKSIIAYFESIDAPRSSMVLREELKIDDSFSAEMTHKYGGLLEKKWTGVVRLQKKVMGLESTIASLRAELDSIVPASARRNHDPSSWLPGPLSHHTLQSHRQPITSVAFHPVFSVLASSSEDCTIKIWDWELGELEKTVRGHTRAVMDVDFGGPKDRVLLASCSTDLTVKLWDPGNAYANVRTLLGHDHSVSAVRFLSPTGNLLASASRDASVRIWDVSTGHCVKVIRAHSDWVRTISPSIDGQWLVSGGNDRTAVICSSVSGEVKAVLTGHENHIECCAFAPPASYEYLATLARQKKLIHTASSAEYVATGSRDKTIKIWDAQGTLIKTLVGHDNWIRGLVFHPSGKYLLSVADDKTLRCWDLAQEGRVVRTLEGIHDRFVTCVRWAPDVVSDAGKGGDASSVRIRCVLATGSVDSNVQVFLP